MGCGASNPKAPLEVRNFPDEDGNADPSSKNKVADRETGPGDPLPQQSDSRCPVDADGPLSDPSGGELTPRQQNAPMERGASFVTERNTDKFQVRFPSLLTKITFISVTMELPGLCPHENLFLCP